jgi:hypothetical protein
MAESIGRDGHRACKPARAVFGRTGEVTMDDTVQWPHKFTAGNEATVKALWDRYLRPRT